MIRSYFGLKRNPFELREIELLPLQQEIHDTLKVHCQQGGLCLVLGVPGTGKSVIKQSLQQLPENQYLVATVGVLFLTAKDGMEDNLCRCGAHVRIIEAVQTAAEEMKGGSK